MNLSQIAQTSGRPDPFKQTFDSPDSWSSYTKMSSLYCNLAVISFNRPLLLVKSDLCHSQLLNEGLILPASYTLLVTKYVLSTVVLSL